jgi:hypothetical protein
MVKSVARFGIVLILMTVICTMVWGGFVTDSLYNCSDAIGFDYLHPGDWVHGHVAFVHHVVAGRSMSEPDTVKEDWSIAGLWCLWFAFFGASLVVSILLARTEWIPRNQLSVSLRSAPCLPSGGEVRKRLYEN